VPCSKLSAVTALRCVQLRGLGLFSTLACLGAPRVGRVKAISYTFPGFSRESVLPIPGWSCGLSPNLRYMAGLYCFRAQDACNTGGSLSLNWVSV
jgi:hypothetical protein